MKSGNLFLIVLTSIVTFIGLAFSKIYDKYIKNNWLVQIMLYSFWTLLAFRILAWVAKPIIPHGIPKMLQNIDLSNINVSVNLPNITPLVSLLIFVGILILACLYMTNLIKKMGSD